MLKIKKDGTPDLRFKKSKKYIKSKKNLRLKRLAYTLVFTLALSGAFHTYIAYASTVGAIRYHNKITRKILRPVKASCVADCKDTSEVLTGQEKQRLTSVELIHLKDWDGDLMEAIARWESNGWGCGLEPNAFHNNENGTQDRGLFQINENTFADFQRRLGAKMAAQGIYTFDQMFDPEKNIDMAYLVWLEQGEQAWVGYNHGLWQTCWASVGKE